MNAGPAGEYVVVGSGVLENITATLNVQSEVLQNITRSSKHK